MRQTVCIISGCSVLSVQRALLAVLWHRTSTSLKNCLKRIRAVSKNRAIAIDSKSGSWMRNCAFLSKSSSELLTLVFFFILRVLRCRMCFFWLFRRWHGVSSSTRAIPTQLERARNILGSFELQLLDPSCRNCCRVLVFLTLCAGTWDRSPCPACRDGSHILQPRLVRLSHRRLQRSKSHLSVMELHFLLSLVFPILTLFVTASWKRCCALPNCLLRSTLSVDVTSQIWRSYLELCESLDVSETFLERSASKLLLFLQQVWLLRSTSTQNLCLRHCPCCCVGNGLSLRSFRSLLSFLYSGAPGVSWFEASCHSCLWNLLLDRA